MASASSRLRVGVIGCGVGRAHLMSYATLPDDVEVVALAGMDEDRCRRLAAEFNIPRLFSDYRELLAQPDIEAVSVCTPNYLHAPITIAAWRQASTSWWRSRWRRRWLRVKRWCAPRRRPGASS